ncbi:DUF2065 domain-containing protein [Maritalea mediterranea]|uniref:DUF2065 domain-containing protein n=1 Tax=Maritalea mediterranea TaxID=2909667 RepID=A0ABS9EAH0_9HYPH|nr:DUF2065 domain-containing protein [Maritalea mediterranea]MCF4098894.1 DUF2065 domain-containing protein [Maritalea mediterranea]
MKDLFIALALAICLEGLLYAALPQQMKRAIAVLLETPESQIRVIGITTAIIGFIVVVWLRAV